jgi:hypothetical protein
MALIDLPDSVREKSILKMVKRINDAHEKGDTARITEEMKGIFKDLQDDPDDPNLDLYLLSIIGEEYPGLLTAENMKIIESYLENKDPKLRVNSLVIYGAYSTYQVNNNENLPADQINNLINLLADDNAEIRQNVAVFLEDIIDPIANLLLTKLNFLLDDVLKKEKVG